MHAIYLKNAEYGYSKFLPGIAGGTKQIDIIGTAFVERDVLNLGEWMVPLQSAHTQSGDASVTDEGGRPTKKNEEKADKTIENIESGG